MGARPSFSLTEDEVIKLKQELNKHNNQLKYIFDIFIYTGMRESEYNYLVQDWKKNKNRWLNVYIPKQSNRRVNGIKTTELIQRQIMMPKMTYKALLNNDWEIKEVSISTIKSELKKIEVIANSIGINRKISPHDLRATFINLLKHRGYDIWDVKNITKHADIKSLISYFERDSDVIKQAYESLEGDRYDNIHPKLLAKENNRLRDEIKILRAKLAEKENI